MAKIKNTPARQYWFVEIKLNEKLGIDIERPYVVTSRRAIDTRKGKDEEKEIISLKGNVESKYLYATLLGSDILPFCNLPSRSIVLPIEPRRNKYEIIDTATLKMKGDLGMADWMLEVEKKWNERRKEKSKSLDIYNWLDYRTKLTTQDPSSKYLVLYLTSSTFLASCLIDMSDELKICLLGPEIKLSGLIVDTKCYFYHTDNLEEAHYLVSILNSRILDTLIKPLQSRGLWGPRDIHKKPLEFPIPLFDSNNYIHKRLSELGVNSSAEAKSLLPSLLTELKIEPESIGPNAVGRLRSTLRKSLEPKIIEIDELVCEVLSE